MKQPASALACRWPALLLALLPGLLAAKGCYFGEQDVPLGGNLDELAGGQASADETAAGGGAPSSDVGGASGSATRDRPAGTEMRAPGVFQVH